jgi:hypothetical protein
MLLSFLAMTRLMKPLIDVREESYRGWPGCIRISNGIVDLVVLPQVGRIIRFGRKGGPNLLYEGPIGDGNYSGPVDGWKNFGGDKLWPAPQSRWNWPPEAGYDSTPWKVTKTPNGVFMRSVKPGEKTGVLFERRVTLAEHSSTVSIENKMVNATEKSSRLAVWEVCQAKDPMYGILPRHVTSSDLQGWHPYDSTNVSSLVDVFRDRVQIRRDPRRGLKYGSASPAGFVAARIGASILVLRAPFRRGAEYVDGGKAQQMFTSGDPLKYIELEITGPVTDVAPHGSISLSTTLSVRAAH